MARLPDPTSGQEPELYDYDKYGLGEVTNSAPDGSKPEPQLYTSLYSALFDPTTGAVATELRKPLPAYLKYTQRKAIADYLAYEASLGS